MQENSNLLESVRKEKICRSKHRWEKTHASKHTSGGSAFCKSLLTPRWNSHASLIFPRLQEGCCVAPYLQSSQYSRMLRSADFPPSYALKCSMYGRASGLNQFPQQESGMRRSLECWWLYLWLLCRSCAIPFPQYLALASFHQAGRWAAWTLYVLLTTTVSFGLPKAFLLLLPRKNRTF